MEYSSIGLSNTRISRICFGCWAIGGHGYGHVCDQDSINAIHKAIDNGINFFDTADVYGFGHSEKILGKALRGKDNVIIASKYGVSWDSNGKTRIDSSTPYLLKSIEKSLKRLRVDCIDLYQLHWHDEATPIDSILELLLKLKKQGKIRFIGLSNIKYNHLESANISHVDAIQIKYNMNKNVFDKQLYNYSRKMGLETLVYGVLGRGMFSGKYTKQSVFSKNDTRDSDNNITKYKMQYLEFARILQCIGEKYKKTSSQVSIRYALDDPLVSCTIVGMKTVAQVLENIGSLGWRLSEVDIQNLQHQAIDLFT